MSRLNWTLCSALALGMASILGTASAMGPAVSYFDIKNPEDIAPIGETGMAIVSSFAPAVDGAAPLYLLDLSGGNLTPLHAAYPDNTVMDGECGAPEAPVHAHGIDIHPKSDGYYELLVVNHGGREAIEIYEINMNGDGPTLAWTGCEIVPAEISPNDVTALPDGAFAVSSFGMKDDPESVQKILSGQPTGAIVEWTVSGGWHTHNRTSFSGPNGVIASPDGTELYVADWGTSSIHVLTRSDGSLRKLTDLDFHPDNLSLTADGHIVAAGQFGTPEEIWACVLSAEPRCDLPGRVTSINPETGEVMTLIDTGDSYGAVSIGLVYGGTVWVGAFHDDRLARYRDE
ncbi:SMP-30/gluconolactonase/LRE family protein [Parvularcula marina]|uniref:SMP-30/gluconolactonase/LRE family protein n=1 Tax=Parvularcula marina TaxID=2292771 RepID=UPI0035160038